jgi:hypothetical protein
MTTELLAITGNVLTDGTPIKVSRANTGWGLAWKITFIGTLGNLAPLRTDASMLRGDFPQINVRELQAGSQDIATGDFTYEVQDIYTDSVSPIGGSFVLVFNGKSTPSIPTTISALALQEILRGLSSLYTAKVTKTVLNAVLGTACWSVTFANIEDDVILGSGNIFRMIVQSSSLTGTQAMVRVAEKVKGTNPFSFRVYNLTTGVPYYTRVTAYNSQGFGSSSSPVAMGVPQTQPSAPLNVVSAVQDATSLKVQWAPPLSTNGAPIDLYKVEWFRSAGVPVQQTITTSSLGGILEVQQVTTFASTPSLGGFFKLTFQGQTTNNIAVTAPARGVGSVQEALERLPGMGSVRVSRTISKVTVGDLLVIVGSATTAVAQAPITDVVTCCDLRVGDVLTIAGQSRTITNLAGTTITLATLADAVTTTVPVPVWRSANGFQWTITFGALHVGNVPPLVVSTSDNWSGTSPGIFVSTVQDGVAPISGSFRLTVPLLVQGQIMSEKTPAIPFDASASDLKSALEMLSTVSTVDVTRTVNGFGYNWLVTFSSEASTDVQQILPDGSGLTGPSASIVASITQPGIVPSFYCEAGGAAGSCHTVSAQSSSLSDVIPSLATGIPYMTRVRAHNSEGWSPAAWGTPQWQIPRGPPGPPRNVQLMVLSSTLLKLVWSPSSMTGGTVIRSYRIEWDTSSTFSNVASPGFDYFYEYHVDSSDLVGPYYYNIAVTIQTNYYVRIVAINDRGSSAFALPLPSSVRPANVPPGPPMNPTLAVLSNTDYLVQWNVPSNRLPVFGGNGGVPVTQYMVEWDTSSAFDSPASYAMVSGSSLQYVIGGRDDLTGVVFPVLLPGATYFVRVTAFNGLGASPTAATTPPSASLADQLPYPSSALTLTDLSATSVLGNWTIPPFDGGQLLDSYTFQYDDDITYRSGNAQSVLIPIVHETQTILITSDPIVEEQFVEATVQVTNERQTVRTTVGHRYCVCRHTYPYISRLKIKRRWCIC